MSAFVYVLGCVGPDGCRTYVGWTLDLERRLAEHNGGGRGGAKSTRGRHWLLLYAERHGCRIEAMRREWHLKRDRGLRRKLAQAAQGFQPLQSECSASCHDKDADFGPLPLTPGG